jgi:acyl-homoserine-lactone acylase
MRRKWLKRIGIVLAALVAFAALNLVVNIGVNSAWYASLSRVPAPEATYAAEIRRDSWGVPHIVGETDADAAFGLAYAHAEDDFATLQEVLASSNGRLAEITGQAGAGQDFVYHLLNIRPHVEAGYADELSAETRALIEAYADGLNLYASEHPEEIRLRGLFPVTGRDIATGFAFTSPFFYGIDRTLTALVAGEAPPRHGGPATERGSNAFAIAPRRSPDGATRLIVNSHQPWTGAVAWYEAHVTSAEGLDMMGGLFPGAPVPLVGHNRTLGWASTVNRPDLVDVYELNLNNSGNAYRYDGRWEPLISRRVWLHVRMGPFVVPVPQTVYTSIHGPVIVNEHGAYAIRYAGIGEIRQVEQYYRLARAENFEQWRDAMRMQAIASTNYIYADATGRIGMFYNARFPNRAAGYDWRGVIRGDTSRAVWTSYLPFDEVPTLIDPRAGYVFDANNTPCIATAPADDLDCTDFAPRMGVEPNITNRMLRIVELMAGMGSIGPAQINRVKYDAGYSRESAAGLILSQIAALNVPAGSDLAAAQGLLEEWDWSLDGTGSADALAAAVLRPIMLTAYIGDPLPEARDVLVGATEFLMEHYQRLDPPLEDVLRLRRGETDLPLTGGPDALRAVYWSAPEGSAMVGNAGDSYIMEGTWPRNGPVRSRSVHQFGTATNRPNSPHYADQAPLFVAQQLRPTWFDPDELEPNIECRYAPGETATTQDGSPCPR